MHCGWTSEGLIVVPVGKSVSEVGRIFAVILKMKEGALQGQYLVDAMNEELDLIKQSLM